MIRFDFNSEDIRQLCIRRNWYTCGTCADYDAMLHHVFMFGHALGAADAEEFAERVMCDIRMHSDTERIKRDACMDYGEIGDDMMLAILNTARVYFE